MSFYAGTPTKIPHGLLGFFGRFVVVLLPKYQLGAGDYRVFNDYVRLCGLASVRILADDSCWQREFRAATPLQRIGERLGG